MIIGRLQARRRETPVRRRSNPACCNNVNETHSATTAFILRGMCTDEDVSLVTHLITRMTPSGRCPTGTEIKTQVFIEPVKTIVL